MWTRSSAIAYSKLLLHTGHRHRPPDLMNGQSTNHAGSFASVALSSAMLAYYFLQTQLLHETWFRFPTHFAKAPCFFDLLEEAFSVIQKCMRLQFQSVLL
nr:hypothetical protein Iba_chr08bCG8380 [Ipomoea batatas]